MKIKFFIIIALIVYSFSYSQKKTAKTIQQQANEYKIWFEKLNVYQKRDAARNLVQKLNSMPPECKGIWLAVLKDKKKETTPISMSSEDIEKGIIRITKINIKAHFFDPVQDSLVSIKIIAKMSNKDWALKENTVIQKNIDSIKIVLEELKKERLELKKIIPENFDEQENQNDTLNRDLYRAYDRIEELEITIPILTTKLAHYPEAFLKGVSDNFDKINWDDEKPSSFLVEVISNPNDGLDNIPETHYFIGEYIPGKEFWIDGNKSQSVISVSKSLKIALMEKDDPYSMENIIITEKEEAYQQFYSKYSYLTIPKNTYNSQ